MRIAATGTADRKGTFLVYYRPYREAIPRMAACGYNEVEIHIEDSACMLRDQLQEPLKTYSVRLTSIGTGTIYGRRHYSLVDSDSPVRQAAIQHLCQHMITAQPDHGLIITGLITGRMQDCTYQGELFWNLEESLYQLDQLAESYDVQLGFELANRYKREHLIRMANGVEYPRNHDYKRILLHLDTVHMNIEEANIRRSIPEAKGYVGHVHIADNDRWYPGYGHYSFLGILQTLEDIRYGGILALETNYLPSEKISARKSLENLRVMLGQLK